jgi:hypothetical protein
MYFCCCRSKTGGARRQGPYDEDPENPRQQQSGGGGLGNLRSLITGAGGDKFLNFKRLVIFKVLIYFK